MIWKKDYLGVIGYYLRIVKGEDYFHFNNNWYKYSLLNKYWLLQEETKQHIIVKLISYELKGNNYLQNNELLKINKEELKKYII